MKTAKYTYDVCVAGGGPGGLSAAIAAARGGAKVLIVEKNGYLGGNATLGLPLLGYLDRAGNQVNGGLSQEYLDRLSRMGATWGTAPCGLHDSVTVIQPDVFKIMALDFCRELKIDILFHLESLSVNRENGRIRSVDFWGKGMKVTVEAKIFIDGTGDGDVAYLAGCSYEMGQKGTGVLQPPTLMFSLLGFNEEKFFAWLDAHPEMISFHDAGTMEYSDDYNVNHFRTNKSYVFLGLRPLFRKWLEEGTCPVARDTLIYINSMNPGQIFMNCTRQLRCDGSDILSLTKGEIEAQGQILPLIERIRKEIPGFEDVRLDTIMPFLGIRETRRFKGLRRLTQEDVEGYRVPDDTVALGGYQIDIHSGTDDKTWGHQLAHPYGIPYGCMVSAEIPNLMFVGRCISMDAVALSTARVMPTCMCNGEGAGTGAAIAIRKGIDPGEVDVKEVRADLLSRGAILSSPD